MAESSKYGLSSSFYYYFLKLNIRCLFLTAFGTARWFVFDILIFRNVRNMFENSEKGRKKNLKRLGFWGHFETLYQQNLRFLFEKRFG